MFKKTFLPRNLVGLQVVDVKIIILPATMVVKLSGRCRRPHSLQDITMFDLTKRELRFLVNAVKYNMSSGEYAKGYLLVHSVYAVGLERDKFHGINRNRLYDKLGKLSNEDSETLLQTLKANEEVSCGI